MAFYGNCWAIALIPKVYSPDPKVDFPGHSTFSKAYQPSIQKKLNFNACIFSGCSLVIQIKGALVDFESPF
jgi:hypothetical protein